jgi:hypothetical protein
MITTAGGVLKRQSSGNPGGGTVTFTRFLFEVVDGGLGRADYARTFLLTEAEWEDSFLHPSSDCGRFYGWDSTRLARGSIRLRHDSASNFPRHPYEGELRRALAALTRSRSERRVALAAGVGFEPTGTC